MTVDEFRRLTPDEFVRDHLLCGLPGRVPGVSEAAARSVRSLTNQIADFAAFGATFRSLQEGLGVLPGAGLEVYDPDPRGARPPEPPGHLAPVPSKAGAVN